MPTLISLPSRSAAAAISFNPTTSIAATQVQAAIAELAAETVDLSSNQTIGGTKTFTGGTTTLDNATANYLVYGSAGVNFPTFNSRSAGAKVVLRPSVSVNTVDYAIGVGSGTLWNAIPQNNTSVAFRWFGGATEIASLRGDGLFTIPQLTVNSVNAWTSVTFQNSWANFLNGNATAAYRKLPDGTVEVKGVVSKATTPTAGEIIFTLPVGFRPLENRIFENLSNNALGRVDVLSNGNVTFNLGSNTWFNLQPISFVAEQ